MSEYTQEDREAAWGAMVKMKHDLDNPAPNDQLTAAGGWCAPSVVTYNMTPVIAVNGLINLPSVMVTRGGVKFP